MDKFINKNQIRRIVFYFTIFIIPLFSVSAGDKAEMWKKMYNRVDTIDQQYAVMQNVVALDDPTLTEMLDFALAAQISTLANQMSRTEEEKKEPADEAYSFRAGFFEGGRFCRNYIYPF